MPSQTTTTSRSIGFPQQTVARSVDLLRNTSSRIRREQQAGVDGAELEVWHVDFDVRAASVSGWQRLKFVWPGARIRRLVVEASGARASAIPYDRVVHECRAGFYVFIGSDVEKLHVQIAADTRGAAAALKATLRRIHGLEYAWRAGRRALLQPIAYTRYFVDPIDAFVISEEFPAPSLRSGQNAVYRAWIKQREKQVEEELRKSLSVAVNERPRVAVLMPVCDPDPTYLRAAIESVRAQTSPEWQLCIADDASTRPDVRELLSAAARDDNRIRLILRTSRGHISAATNDAFALADAPLVTSLDHDDLLAPSAVELAAGFYAARPDTELLYSDEDKIDQHGHRFLPYFKPDFSPELLYSCNYINHLAVHRTDNIRRAGGWRSAFDGAQDYDLLLRTLEFADSDKIRHLPAVLYHWRAIGGSAALSLNYEPCAIHAGRAAVAEHLGRRNVQAKVTTTSHNFYRVQYALPSPAPKVAIIIPTRDKATLLNQCVESIRASTRYPNYEIVVVDNGSTEPDALALLEAYRATPRMRLLSWPGAFNYSTINNYAVRSVDGDFVCLLNNDVEVITPDWLSDMMGYAVQPGVGCVGAKLLYENDTVQHAGVVIGLGGVAGHAFLRMASDAPGYFGRAVVTSNWSAVTGACLLVRRDIYLDVGGLDEQGLPVAFNDIDFCLRVRDAGHRNVLTPFAQLHHYESQSRGLDDTPDKISRSRNEVEFMRSRHGDALLRDPFYSPHLDLEQDFSIRVT